MKQSVLMQVIACSVLASLLPSTAGAQEAPAEPLTAEAELGFLTTSGNTSSTALKAKLKVQHELSAWRNRYVLESFYNEDRVEIIDEGVSREDSQVTAEKYFASAQANYKLDAGYQALFIFGSYDKDHFSGYDFQASLAAGYTNRLFQTNSAFLEYSIGPGISFNRTEAVRDANGALVTAGFDEQSAMVRVAALYQYEFSENAKFTQSFASDVVFESGANTKSKAESALTATINSSFAMKASFSVTHNSVVPEDRVSTDKQTAVTLVYTYH